MAKDINCVTILITTLEGNEKIKTEKKWTMEQSEEYFFQQRCKKMATLSAVLASTGLHCHVAISTVLMKLIVFSPLKLKVLY